MKVTSGLYRHYKGGMYRVLFTARNSTNGTNDEELVVYVSIGGEYAGRLSVRDAAEFVEEVEVPLVYSVGTMKVPRFERVGD